MRQQSSYLDSTAHPLVSIVSGVDKDVERGEDFIMLGYSFVLMAPIFAPIAPPRILLPLMALVFVLSVCIARTHFLNIRRKFLLAKAELPPQHDKALLQSIDEVFAEHPKSSLTDGFNPLKNLMRTAKSFLGAMMINSFWMPIFYMMGLQFVEDKQLSLLNRAVIAAEEKTARWRC